MAPKARAVVVSGGKTGTGVGRPSLRLFAVLLALVAGVAGVTGVARRSAGAAPQDYRFVKVADSVKDGLDPSAFGCPTVNDGGDVAFKAGRSTPDGFDTTFGIYRANASDGRLVTVAREGRRFGSLGSNPSMNDAGQVSFAATLELEDPRTGNNIEKILRGNGRGLTTIASTEDRFNFFVFDTSINNDGRVAFAAELDERFGFDEGLFSGRGDAVTTYYLASTSQFDGSTGRPAINDRGRIAFTERRDGREGVFATRARGGFETIAQAGPDGFVGDPSYNNAGTAAFITAYTDEASGRFVNAVVTGDGGPTTTVATSSDSFGGFGQPSINDAGDVAFQADFNGAADTGIFVNSSRVEDRVISTGDTLDGSTVRGLTFCEEGLSDTGRLAFVATLEDPDSPDGPRTAVFRARPRM